MAIVELCEMTELVWCAMMLLCMPSPRANTMPSTLQGLSILVAEDSWHLASAMKRLLSKAGASVVGPVGCVRKALALIESTAIDIAIVDIDLKGQSCEPVLDALAGRGIITVVASGFTNHPVLLRPSIEVLKKPVAATVMLAKLEALATSRR